MFPVYLKLGFHHILDLQGYDHILFIMALCAIFSWKDWRRVLILVTAFTIGHSVTLAMSALDIIRVDASLIEFLIPITILLTALQNLWYKPGQSKRWMIQYALALFFGFIHGMGFANFFKSLLGLEANIVVPLLAFNLGVEIGQLCIVACFFILNYLIVGKSEWLKKYWIIAISLICAAMAIYLMIK